MKFIKHIFEMKLSQKEMVRAKRVLALFMIPIFVLQMCSINLFLTQVARAEDEAVVIDTTPVSDPAPKEEPKVETPKEEVSPVAEVAPVAATVETPVVSDAPVLTEQPSDEVVAPAIQEPVISESTAETVVPIVETPKETWSFDGNKATTNNPVEKDVTYKAPQNDQVTVTFTKLPDNPGTLSIEEVALTDEQVATLGALSNKAYDITSDMADGTFKYELSLPKPANQEKVEIKFAENLSELNKNSETVPSKEVNIENTEVNAILDHFTVYVVVEWNFPNNPDDAIADGGVPMNSAKTITVSAGVSGLGFPGVGTSYTARATGWDSGSGLKFWRIIFDSTGFENLKISSKQRSSDTGPRDFKIQYKIGASGAWTDFGPASITVANDYSSGAISNISLPDEANNQPDVRIRWIMTSNIAVNLSSVASGGASNIDDIIVTGDDDMTPPVLSLPADITTEATSPSGAVVSFSATATDLNPANPTVTCAPASGATFPIGITAVSCSAADTALNTATGTFNVTVADTTAPAVPNLVSPADGTFLATNNFDFDWDDSSDASTVTYEYQATMDPTEVGGVLINGLWNSLSNGIILPTSTIHSAGAPDGTWYWQVRAIDSLGQTSAWSSIWNVTLDTIVPTVPVLVSPSNDGYLATHNFTFQWNASTDNSPLTYEWEFSYLNTTQADGSFVSQSGNHTNLSTSVDSPGTPDDVYYWHVRAIDSAGNKSGWASPWKVTIDTTAPSVPTHISPADGTYTTTANLTVVDWSDVTDPSTPVSYFYQASLSAVLNPDGSFASPVYTSGALATSQIPANGTPAGTYYWHVRAQDSLGNSSAWSTPWQIVVDNTAPTVFSVDSDSQTYNLATPSPHTIKVTFSEDISNTPTIEVHTTVVGYYVGDCSDGNAKTFCFDYPINKIPGEEVIPHTVYISGAADLAGNIMTQNSAHTFNVDTIAPVATPTQSPDANTAGWNNSDVTITWNWSDEGSGIDTANCTISSISTGEGNPIHLTATCKDLSGNEGSSSYDVKVDKTTPTVSIQSPAADEYINHSTSIPLNYTASDENLNKCWYKLDGGSSIQMPTCNNTTFNAAQGHHSIEVSANDFAGNQTTSTLVWFTVDTTPPTVVLSDDQSDNIVRDADTVNITATFTEGNAIDETNPPTISIHSVGIVNDALMTKVSNLVWTYAWNVPAGYDGTHTVSIDAHDVARNANTPATGKTTYVIDNAAPEITMNGLNPVNITYGVGYTDEGATALDAPDGSVLVSISGDTVTNTSPVGTYHIYYNAVDAAGNSAEQVARTINVGKAEATISLTGGTFTYDNTQHAATGFAYGVGGISDVLSPAIALYYEGTGSTVYASYTAPTNAGTYDVLADFSGNDNYNTAISTTTVTIDQALSATTVICPNLTETYTGSPIAPCTATVTGIGGLDEALTVNYTGNTNVGTVTASATFAGDANHKSSSDSKTFDITKADATIVVTPYDVTYDGLAHTATATVKGVLDEDLSGINLSGTAHTNVGVYVGDTWTFTDVTGNYNDDSGTVDDNISKASLTVTADDITNEYREDDPTFTFVYAGFVSGENSSVIDILPTCTVSVSHSAVGTYPITCSGGIDNNYSFSYVDGTLKIEDTTDPDNVNNFKAVYRPLLGNVKLAWNADDSDIYRVYIYRGGSKNFTVNSSSRITINHRSDEAYTDDNITRGETYYYKVVTVDESDNKSNVKVIKIVIPVIRIPAISTNQGTETLPTGTVLGAETTNNENNNGGQVLGSESQNGNPNGTPANPTAWWQNWWYDLLGLILIIAGGGWFWIIRKRS